MQPTESIRDVLLAGIPEWAGDENGEIEQLMDVHTVATEAACDATDTVRLPETGMEIPNAPYFAEFGVRL